MPEKNALCLSFPQKNIAVLTFDMPDKGANILSATVLDELESHLDELENQRDLAGLIIISGKPGTFIAGADIREFVTSLQATEDHIVAMCRRGQTLFRRLSTFPCVTVAAIDGICVGGGAELAIWCDRRILSSRTSTEYGFPEVKLGLYPGWGGTARTPRVIGLSNAVEMITSGDSIDPQTAQKNGLAADVVAPEQLMPAALSLVQEEELTKRYLKDRETWSGTINISETELGFLGVTASAHIRNQTKGKYPAPEAALELMLSGTNVDIEAACQLEAEGMTALFGSPINASLLNIFFLTDRNKKDSGIDENGVEAQDANQVSVIGAGIMGAGIVAAHLKCRIPILMTDTNEAALQSSASAIIKEISYNKQTKSHDVQRAIGLSPLLNLTMSDAEVSRSDLVIEAIVEDAGIKKELYARLEPLMRDDAILMSNTSTIPIGTLAADLVHPDRFVGMHFFNPVRRMKLVEVIRGEKTSDNAVATAVAHAKRIGKSPIVVNDGPGFLVNRVLLPYMHEALELLSEHVAVEDIERAAKSFGMPMGPLTLYDVVGIDTALYAGRTMWEAYPDRVVASPILIGMLKAERLGQKSGLGFFSYQGNKKRGIPDPGLAKFLEPYMGEARQFTKDELTYRLFLPMLLEATRVLEEEIVRDARDVDLGLIFGLGFPPFKGGLLFWADTIGAANIVELLKPFKHLGERMKPTPLLLEMAKDGRCFYQ